MRFCYQYNFSGEGGSSTRFPAKIPQSDSPPTLERHVERHDILHRRHVMSLQEAIRESINIGRLDSSVLLLLPVGADLDRAAWIRDFQEWILTCSRPVPTAATCSSSQIMTPKVNGYKKKKIYSKRSVGGALLC